MAAIRRQEWWSELREVLEGRMPETVGSPAWARLDFLCIFVGVASIFLQM
jgi:hypothetical protein